METSSGHITVPAPSPAPAAGTLCQVYLGGQRPHSLSRGVSVPQGLQAAPELCWWRSQGWGLMEARPNLPQEAARICTGGALPWVSPAGSGPAPGAAPGSPRSPQAAADTRLPAPPIVKQMNSPPGPPGNSRALGEVWQRAGRKAAAPRLTAPFYFVCLILAACEGHAGHISLAGMLRLPWVSSQPLLLSPPNRFLFSCSL